MEPWSAFLALPVHLTRARLLSKTGPLPESRWWGSTVRGALGSALRFLLCQCGSGRHKPDCLFSRFFSPENLQTQGPKFPPPPWCLAARAEGDQLLVEIRVFGDSSQTQEALGLALEVAGFRGLGKHRLALAGLGYTVSVLGQLAWQEPRNAACLSFESPVRLTDKGRLVQETPTFAQVFSAAQRRVRLCAAAWVGGSIPPPPPEHFLWAQNVPVEAAETSWVEQLRYSRRQQRLMRLGGLVGWIRFGGDWSWAWPWLRLAPLLGLGKLTTMGLGEVKWANGPPVGGASGTALAHFEGFS